MPDELWTKFHDIAQETGIKTIPKNLRYADDITLMAESEGELKSLLMMLKEDREKAGFKKTQHPKN